MNQDTNKFKIVLTGVFVFFILFGLIAFSTFKSDSKIDSQTDIMIWGTMDKVIFDNFILKYKELKNIEFKITYTRKDISLIDGELVEAIAVGRAPDVILIPQELIKRYSDKVVYISAITERMFKDTYVQEAELYLQPEGIFAIPFFVDPLVMYWNRDMFSSAGIANPPSRWSEFPLLASKLSVSDSNANIIKSVASLGEYRNIDNAKAIVSALIMQAGSPITYYEGEILRSSLYLRPEGSILIPSVAALNFFTDYSDPKKSVYSWNRSIPSSKQFFLSGNLATYFGFASEAQDIKEKNPNLNFDVAMLPQILDAQTKVTFGKIYGFAFLRSSVNTQVAFNLISGITSADAINVLLEHVYVAPARRDVISAGSPDPAREVFNNSALIAKGWLDPDTRGTDQIFQDMVENVTTGRMDVDSSAQKASLELDNLLQ